MYKMKTDLISKLKHVISTYNNHDSACLTFFTHEDLRIQIYRGIHYLYGYIFIR